MGVRSHNCIMSGLCCGNTAFTSSPRHYGSIRREFAFKNLVPANDLASLSVEVLLDSCGHIALEIVLSLESLIVLESELSDSGLTFRAVGPSGFRTFVTTDVDVL